MRLCKPALQALRLCWRGGFFLSLLLGGTYAGRYAAGAVAASEGSASISDIVDLQSFRRTESISIEGAGSRRGTATLINLNPDVNAWFILTLDWNVPTSDVSYHIENTDPENVQLHLAGDNPQGLVVSKGGKAVACALWSGHPTALDQASTSSLPYSPLCNDYLYLRNRVAGHHTTLELVTDFLRDHVWKGDEIVGFVRDELYQDAFRESGETRSISGSGRPPPSDAPSPALVAAAYANKAVVPTDLGIALAGSGPRGLGLGRWYQTRNVPSVYVSAIQPQAIDDKLILRDKGKVRSLDSVEASALDYLIAFDLSSFDVGFSLGTDHPRLGWSPRVPFQARNDNLPGPDGIGDTRPLVRTGMVSPAVLNRVVATFTGGFKREHGAFKYGALSMRNAGSHYGFVEDGVVFSKLQPGLATLYGLDDGSVEMKTWSDADNRLLAHLKFARQNGVALVERDAKTGEPIPGELVIQWGPGNWSGSADEKLRTLRAGACIQESDNRKFLLYGYFSTATPSAMALVFQAYGCSYAMQLDINALEHTYVAVYHRQGDKVNVEHLIAGMAQVDKVEHGQLIPRFLGFPDNRDFFYLTRRSNL